MMRDKPAFLEMSGEGGTEGGREGGEGGREGGIRRENTTFKGKAATTREGEGRGNKVRNRLHLKARRQQQQVFLKGQLHLACNKQRNTPSGHSMHSTEEQENM